MIPIFLTLLSIYFVINYDWSKTKVKHWMPYFFVVLLSLYLVNQLLFYGGVDVVKQIQDKKVIETFFTNLSNK